MLKRLATSGKPVNDDVRVRPGRGKIQLASLRSCRRRDEVLIGPGVYWKRRAWDSHPQELRPSRPSPVKEASSQRREMCIRCGFPHRIKAERLPNDKRV